MEKREYKKREYLSVSVLDELYYKSTHGKSITDIANSLGVPVPTAHVAVKIIRQYMGAILSKKLKPYMNKKYLQAAKNAIKADNASLVKAEEKVAEEVPDDKELVEPAKVEPSTTSALSPDRFNKLGLAFAMFSDNVQAFIDEQVEAKVGHIMRENAELKDAMDNARSFNWSESLRKKYKGEL